MTDVLEILELLPPQCASINAATGESILIARGVIGYYPAPVGWTSMPTTNATA